ncbi:MAG: carbonic anhydrase [Hyphomonadaceae bacterium]
MQSLYRKLALVGQSPKTLVIACADSRVDPAAIFDAGPGELFIVRNVANLAPPYEEAEGHHGTSAAIEFAVQTLKVETILVLGHAQCGGVAAAISGAPPNSPFLAAWVDLLSPAKARLSPQEKDPHGALEHESIRVSLENLLTFPFVQSAVDAGRLTLRGARFGVADGILEVLDPETGEFSPVD